MNLLYFIALVIPEPLRTEVEGIKKSWEGLYGVRHALKSPPHITIVPPFRPGKGDTPDMFRERLSSIVKMAENLHPFRVTVSGFGSFPKKVIYLNVIKATTPELEQVYRLLQEKWIWGETGQADKSKSKEGFTPHITLAHRDLDTKTYDRIWLSVSDQGFHRSFLVDRIFLLSHNGKNWEAFYEVEFLVG